MNCFFNEVAPSNAAAKGNPVVPFGVEFDALGLEILRTDDHLVASVALMQGLRIERVAPATDGDTQLLTSGEIEALVHCLNSGWAEDSRSAGVIAAETTQFPGRA
jgi:hypothetical protein